MVDQGRHLKSTVSEMPCTLCRIYTVPKRAAFGINYVCWNTYVFDAVLTSLVIVPSAPVTTGMTQAFTFQSL